MSTEVLDRVLQNTLPTVTESFGLMFQGGEPTLAGLDFFKATISLAEKHNTNKTQITYAIQTNGLLITAEWCEFFRQHDFLVGLSLDGPAGIHNANRVDSNGKGSHKEVMIALELLQKHNVATNILTVITEESGGRVREIDAFFRQIGVDFIQHIPCLDPIGDIRGKKSFSLSSKGYQRYLKASFDIWYKDIMEGNYRSNRYFDNLVLMLHGQQPEACSMRGVCSHQYIVEADGSTYPCDFYAMDKYFLGNLTVDSVEQINATRQKIMFIENSMKVEEKCKKCPWFSLCRGGCRRDRDYFGGGIGGNYYCSAYKNFFEHSYDKLRQVAQLAKGGL